MACDNGARTLEIFYSGRQCKLMLVWDVLIHILAVGSTYDKRDSWRWRK